MPEPFSELVEKPWGSELILSKTDSPVTSKILTIKKGQRFSLQKHDTKEEILTLIEGEAFIYLGDTSENTTKTQMVKNKGYLIPRNHIHRVEAISDSKIFESSTPESGTTLRLEDDYSRGDETEAARSQRSQVKGIYKG